MNDLNKEVILTPSLIRLLGHLVGCGGIHAFSSHSFKTSYRNKDIALVNKFINDYKSEFPGYSIAVCQRKNRSYDATNQSTYPAQWLLNNFPELSGGYKTERSIPKQIFFISDELKGEFLRSIFDDNGSVTKNGFIQLNSINKKLIEEISTILSSLAIDHSFNKSITSNKKDLYYLIIRKGGLNTFREKIGFHSQDKLWRLTKIITRIDKRIK